MNLIKRKIRFIFIWSIAIALPIMHASAQMKVKKHWYISWGYNSEMWMPSNILISENALGNNFTVHNVSAHDEPGWTSGIFNQQITIPQFSARVGFFFDDAQTNGFELSLDHTKYTTTANQSSIITGVVSGTVVNENVILSPEYFSYMLHNGANHLMVNYVKKTPIFRRMDQNVSIQGILKVGGGVMLPHAENTIMGFSNDVGPKVINNFFGIGKGWWRYGGYTAGLEYGIRLAPVKWVFVELTNKIAYSNLSDIPVYKGIARQELWMMEGILSVGVQL